MATEVGFIALEGKPKEDPITRDLLGGCSSLRDLDSKDLDLGLGVASASCLENRLDFLPGKLYLRNHSRPLQDLNQPPTTISLQVPENNPRTNPDLHVAVSPVSLPSPSSYTYHSVCTIEKVKSALDRLGHESRSKSRDRSDGSPSPSTSSITSASPMKRARADRSDGCDSSVAGASNSLMAAACPNCLLYVLISKENPKCPRCDSHVPPPVLGHSNINNKRPRFDLNSTRNFF